MSCPVMPHQLKQSYRLYPNGWVELVWGIVQRLLLATISLLFIYYSKDL